MCHPIWWKKRHFIIISAVAALLMFFGIYKAVTTGRSTRHLREDLEDLELGNAIALNAVARSQPTERSQRVNEELIIPSQTPATAINLPQQQQIMPLNKVQ